MDALCRNGTGQISCDAGGKNLHYSLNSNPCCVCALKDNDKAPCSVNYIVFL